MINRITISGFRGILRPVHFNLSTDSSSAPLIIYGRNGTGKSSVTDAWEWFQSGKIEHLRKEGAREAAYPHKYAEQGQSYVEVEFADEGVGIVRADFNHDRITIPVLSGNMDDFRRIAPHPCQIRYSNLTLFVYMTKSDKFKELAVLMGFTPQVELQAEISRLERELKAENERMGEILQNEVNNVAELLSLDKFEEESVFSGLNSILNTHNIKQAKNWEEMFQKPGELNSLIVEDPIAKRISQLDKVQTLYQSFKVEDEVLSGLTGYQTDTKEFISDSFDLSRILLMGLYEQGKGILELDDPSIMKVVQRDLDNGKTIDVCPLCGDDFDGDLLEHILGELDLLKDLKDKIDKLNKSRESIFKDLPNPNEFKIAEGIFGDSYEEIEKEFNFKGLEKNLLQVRNAVENTRKSVSKKAIDLDSATVDDLESTIRLLKTNVIKLREEIRNRSQTIVQETANYASHNKDKTALVADHSKVDSIVKGITRIRKLDGELKNRQSISVDFTKIVDDFSKSSIENVERRFSLISDDVKRFFDHLEQGTEGLQGAKLRLLSDESRAVELEVMHHGESTFPAYKYLSESQLNSFGLAVFLASAKFFNPAFKFIILDDIVNSFDGHKRPLIIDLLKNDFKDHQLVISTHDSYWRDRLFEALPGAKKVNFYKWEVNVGPFLEDGKTPLEEINAFLDIDQPHNAGRNLGPFLERNFQMLGERFEMLITYNRGNIYTLDPLIDRFRIRTSDKLGKDHPLTIAVRTLEEDTGFRNVLSHEKNVEIQLTSDELRRTVELWKEIENLTKCNNPDCYEYVAYDRPTKTFVCKCGQMSLSKSP